MQLDASFTDSIHTLRAGQFQIHLDSNNTLPWKIQAQLTVTNIHKLHNK